MQDSNIGLYWFHAKLLMKRLIPLLKVTDNKKALTQLGLSCTVIDLKHLLQNWSEQPDYSMEMYHAFPIAKEFRLTELDSLKKIIVKLIALGRKLTSVWEYFDWKFPYSLHTEEGKNIQKNWA